MKFSWKLVLTILAAVISALLSYQALAAATAAPSIVDVTTDGQISTSVTGVPSSYSIPARVSDSCRLTSGTGTGKIDLAPYVASSTLGGAASTSIDVRSYADQLGATVSTMTKLKFLWIDNTGTVAIDVGGAAATQLIGTGFLKDGTDIITIAAGQSLMVCVPAGITVSGSAKDLKILNTDGGTSATFDIIIAGSSS